MALTAQGHGARARGLQLGRAAGAHRHACSALIRRLVRAPARREDVDEEVYSLERGWSSEAFDDVATELTRRLKENVGRQPPPGSDDLQSEVWMSTEDEWTVRRGACTRACTAAGSRAAAAGGGGGR